VREVRSCTETDALVDEVHAMPLDMSLRLTVCLKLKRALQRWSAWRVRMAAASSMVGKQQWVLEEAPHPQGGTVLVDKRASKVYTAADGQWPRLVGQLESSTGAITVRPSRASGAPWKH
jgi:hypothetical protein